MKIPRFLRLAGASGLVLGALSLPVLALQEEGGEGGKHKKSWLQLFATTGPVGYLMLACSIAGTTLVIEHLVTLRREKLAPSVLAGDLEALINEEEYDQAIELADENPCYLSNVVGSALRMRDAGYQEMITGLEAAANEETFKLSTKISYLSLIGNVAPLLGLLGTVTGMISSFQVIETLKAPTPGDLAKGVYESLVNTTMGLFIAIVFLTLYFLFKNKVSRMCLSINLQAVDMLRHLATAEKAVA
jgi:biopolymer transport protein ExbB